MAVTALEIIRWINYSVIGVFTVIILGLSAGALIIFGGNLPPAAFAIVAALLTQLVGGTFLTLEFFRTGLATSQIFVEIIWTGVAGLFWLAVGAVQASQLAPAPNCSLYEFVIGETGCEERTGVTALAFLNWLMLWGWAAFLLIMCTIAHNRGNTRVWFATVATAGFFSKGTGSVPLKQWHEPAGQYEPYKETNQPYNQPSSLPQPRYEAMYGQDQYSQRVTPPVAQMQVERPSDRRAGYPPVAAQV